ncbi:unnamed protein product [Owenia fusiformis]|uniref:dCMP deaminase n=1 Tax=Owenia fusiformis TaxID=6347 RepID=A0A8J1U597_OWEFU|nr:unnamed protein product [Owenia fusiformis]
MADSELPSDVQPPSDIQLAERHIERPSKEVVFMLLAWWLEYSPDAKDPPDITDMVEGEEIVKKYNKLGALIVTPETRVLAMDCTRGEAHVVQKLILLCRTNGWMLDGCVLYTSRLPCSHCTKLMVQAKLKKVYCLPIEPELYDPKEFIDSDRKAVDKLYRINGLGISYLTPNVTNLKVSPSEEIFINVRTPKYELKRELLFDEEFYRDEEAAGSSVNAGKWKEGHLKRCKEDFAKAARWLSDKTFGEIPKDIHFANRSAKAMHTLRMANILVLRSDDPKTGVGAVITKGDSENEVYCGLGWNGFPQGAQHSDYPRAAEKTDVHHERKYPYVVHGEINALSNGRNWHYVPGDFKSYQTKIPCDDCTPVLYEMGVREIYHPSSDSKKRQKSGIGYSKIQEYCEKKKIKCFEATKSDKPGEK